MTHLRHWRFAGAVAGPVLHPLKSAALSRRTPIVVTAAIYCDHPIAMAYGARLSELRGDLFNSSMGHKLRQRQGRVRRQ